MAEGETLLLSLDQPGDNGQHVHEVLQGVHGKLLRCSNSDITLNLVKSITSYPLQESNTNQSKVNSYGQLASKLNRVNIRG